MRATLLPSANLLSLSTPIAGARRLRGALLAAALLGAAAALSSAEGPGPAPAPQKDLDTSGLERLNAFRKAADLPPVTLDPALCGDCRAHAEYLARNWVRLSKEGLPTNDESPSLPAFSEEGKAAARAGFGGYNPKDPLAFIDQSMASVFIRPMLLEPELERIGWGKAREDKGGWFAVLDVSRGKGSTEVIAYPAAGQKDVPLAYPGSELPDPIPEARQKRAGYPITVTFPQSLAVKDVTARLARGDEEVTAWLSTPEKPAKDTQFQHNTICLIAREPLRANTTYSVTVKATAGGAPWSRSWDFTTGKDETGPSRGAVKDHEAAARAVLEQVNDYRQAAGLGAVALDPALTKSCQAHADYLVRNAGDPSIQGLGAHDEDPKLPGCSVAGHRAGRASDIYFGPDPEAAVDFWMASLFHRVPLLAPELKRIGYGVAGTGTERVAVLNVHGGHGSGRPVLWPADGAKDVPLAYHAGERPDPIPESKTKKAGYPVSVAFPTGTTVTEAAARLSDPDGKEVSIWLSSPEKSVDAELQRNSVCLIAQESLKPKTSYTVTVSARVDGADWKKTWSFTTADGR
jgi:uncharacterized protein YkwD